MKISLAIVSLLFFFITTSVKDPIGIYDSIVKTRDGRSDGFIKIDKKGTFTYANWGGCSVYFEIKGKWVLNNDTLILSGEKKKLTKTGAWEKLNSQSKYLLKNDSLIHFKLWNGEPLYERAISYIKAVK